MAAAVVEARQSANDPRVRGLVEQASMRALLDALADLGADAALEPALGLSAPPAPRPAPETLTEAKHQLIAARADLTRLRVAIRRGGWRRREALRFTIADRVAAAPDVFWTAWPGHAPRT